MVCVPFNALECITHYHLAMARSNEVFADAENPDAKVKEVKHWLQTKGVRNFEPVSLFCDQLKKVCFYFFH